jgi:hypothetical protein
MHILKKSVLAIALAFPAIAMAKTSAQPNQFQAHLSKMSKCLS